MKFFSSFFFSFLFFLLVSPSVVSSQDYASPESQGIASENIQFCFDSLMRIKHAEVHGVVVMRHGKVVAELFPEPFNRTYSHTLYSVSKTFVAAAVGLAIDENRLRLNDRVVLFLPEFLQDTISSDWADMTIRDLLIMSSGFEPDWNLRNVKSDWVKNLLLKRLITRPGTQFKYDSMVSYLLSVIVQKVTGETVLDYLNKRIFSKIGIDDAEWEMSPEGYCTGGWGLRMSTLSMAKFGQFLLNRGIWNGEQLLSSSWVREMMSVQQKADKSRLYGYQIWKHDDIEGAFRADGALGQYIIVAPKEDMVIAITQCNRGNGILERKILNDWLLHKVSDKPLRESDSYPNLLNARYFLPVAEGKSSLSKHRKLLDKDIFLNQNSLGWKSIRLTSCGAQLKIVIETAMGELMIFHASNGKWGSDTTHVCPPYSINALGRFSGISRRFLVSSSYGMKNGILCLKILFPNWISGVELFISEENGEIKVKAKENYKKEFTFLK
jgi:CubicO group peptidase (beta-lactamase class C family)